MEKRELIRCFDREESAAAKMVEITVDLLSPVVFLKGGCRSVDLQESLFENPVWTSGWGVWRWFSTWEPEKRVRDQGDVICLGVSPRGGHLPCRVGL